MNKMQIEGINDVRCWACSERKKYEKLLENTDISESCFSGKRNTHFYKGMIEAFRIVEEEILVHEWEYNPD